METRTKVLAFEIDPCLKVRLKRLAAASSLRALLEPELLKIAERLEKQEARHAAQRNSAA